jgi:hypothetical protein
LMRSSKQTRWKRRVVVMTPLPPQTLSTRGTGRGGDTAVGRGQIEGPLQLLRERQRLGLVGRGVAGQDSLTGLGAAAGAREGDERASMNLGEQDGGALIGCVSKCCIPCCCQKAILLTCFWVLMHDGIDESVMGKCSSYSY